LRSPADAEKAKLVATDVRAGFQVIQGTLEVLGLLDD
jgi:hypothetical protein